MWRLPPAMLTLFVMRGGSRSPPWKVFKMLIFDVVMTPTMSRNIFGVIWKFWKNSIFWVILESLLQLKRILDHFKSWNYPFLCVWWGTKSFELIKVQEVCFPGNAPKKSVCQIGLKVGVTWAKGTLCGYKLLCKRISFCRIKHYFGDKQELGSFLEKLIWHKNLYSPNAPLILKIWSGLMIIHGH